MLSKGSAIVEVRQVAQNFAQLPTIAIFVESALDARIAVRHSIADSLGLIAVFRRDCEGRRSALEGK